MKANVFKQLNISNVSMSGIYTFYNQPHISYTSFISVLGYVMECSLEPAFASYNSVKPVNISNRGKRREFYMQICLNCLYGVSSFVDATRLYC